MFYAKTRRWLAGLLVSFGYMLVVVGDEANLTNNAAEEVSQSKTAQKSKKDLWQTIPEKSSPNNGSGKWQRPDSERNKALINQSTSEGFWKDSGSKKNASSGVWQRPDSDRNDSLINEISNAKQQTLWQDVESESITNTDASSDTIVSQSPKTAKSSSMLDDSSIKQHFEHEGPRDLTHALMMWTADYIDQPNSNPITFLSEFFTGAKKYYHDFRNPYIHQLLVEQSFLEIYTGPGSMYPNFYIAESNELVYISAYQSGWYEVELKHRNGQTKVNGWMSSAKIDPFLKTSSRNQNGSGRWFVGTAGGVFANEAMIQGKLGYFFGEQLWLELAISEALEDLSSSMLYQVNLLHAPFGKKTISPFFGIGMGKLKNKPFQTTINQEDSSSSFLDVNLGLQWHFSDSLLFRGDVKNYAIALSDNEIDSHQEYSIGFSVLLDGTAPRGIELDNNRFIDRDDIELGIFLGNLTLEDFLSASIKGLLINYHFNELMFIESRFANADVPLKNNSSFLSIFNPDKEESLSYYSLGFGWNIFTGEAIVKKKSIRNTIYVNTAVGSTSFLNRRLFTAHIGAGVTITPIENWNVKFEVQDLIIEQDVLGGKKTTNNFALQTGISVRF